MDPEGDSLDNSNAYVATNKLSLNAALRYVHTAVATVGRYTKRNGNPWCRFFDWLCDGSDVNEAFKLDEVADLNLPSDLPTTSGQHTGNKRMFAAPMTDAEVQNIIADRVHAFADDIQTWSPNATKNVIPGTFLCKRNF